MVEHQLGSVEELPRSPARELSGPGLRRTAHASLPAPTIDRVPDDRMPDMSEMHTDLMRPSRPERDIEEVRPLPTLAHPDPGDGVPTALDDRHPLAILRISADRCVDRERRLREVTPGRGQVEALHPALS
jgi:hypothetical protein